MRRQPLFLIAEVTTVVTAIGLSVQPVSRTFLMHATRTRGVPVTTAKCQTGFTRTEKATSLKHFFQLTIGVVISVLSLNATADTFGVGKNAFEIEFVVVDDPGNLPDEAPNVAGAVGYRYRMSKYEISEAMIDKANALGDLGIAKDIRAPDKPATSLTWFEAAHFANWLNTSTGHAPAYKFDEEGSYQVWELEDEGYDTKNLFRNKQARYFLPSVDEWHKAAYYDPVADVYYDYPTGSNEIPDGIDFVGDPDFDALFFDGAFNTEPNEITNVGSLSPYGTAGQGGNVAEWQETAFFRRNDFAHQQRGSPGGAWVSTLNSLAAWNTGIGTAPQFLSDRLGLRIASIPEPSAWVLLTSGFWLVTFCNRSFYGKSSC